MNRDSIEYLGHTHICITGARAGLPPRFWDVKLYTEAEVLLLDDEKQKTVRRVRNCDLYLLDLHFSHLKPKEMA